MDASLSSNELFKPAHRKKTLQDSVILRSGAISVV
jgi:hypothetical protein